MDVDAARVARLAWAGGVVRVEASEGEVEGLRGANGDHLRDAAAHLGEAAGVAGVGPEVGGGEGDAFAKKSVVYSSAMSDGEDQWRDHHLRALVSAGHLRERHLCFAGGDLCVSGV